MPVFRNVQSRQSRRLERQIPVAYDKDGWEVPADQVHHYPRAAARAPPRLNFSSSPSPELASLSLPTTPPPTKPIHGRKREVGYIPRPKNAFILFRSWFYTEQRRLAGGQDQNDISVQAGLCWRSLTPEQKRPFQLQAEEEKREHRAKYPDYTYAPGARKEKSQYTRKMETRKADRQRRAPRAIRSIPVVQPKEGTPESDNSSYVSRDNTPRITPEPEHTIRQRSPTPIVEVPSFVSTSDIPSLRLPSPEQATITRNTSLDLALRPPSYDRIDDQFGSRPEIPSVPPPPTGEASGGSVGSGSNVEFQGWSAPEEFFGTSNHPHADWDFEQQTKSAFEHHHFDFDADALATANLLASLHYDYSPDRMFPWNAQPQTPTAAEVVSEQEANEMSQFFKFDLFSG